MSSTHPLETQGVKCKGKKDKISRDNEQTSWGLNPRYTTIRDNDGLKWSSLTTILTDLSVNKPQENTDPLYSMKPWGTSDGFLMPAQSPHSMLIQRFSDACLLEDANLLKIGTCACLTIGGEVGILRPDLHIGSTKSSCNQLCKIIGIKIVQVQLQ